MEMARDTGQILKHAGPCLQACDEDGITGSIWSVPFEADRMFLGLACQLRHLPLLMHTSQLADKARPCRQMQGQDESPQ